MNETYANYVDMVNNVINNSSGRYHSNNFTTSLKDMFHIEYERDYDVFTEAINKIESGQYLDQHSYSTLAKLHTYLVYFVNVIDNNLNMYEFIQFTYENVDALTPSIIIEKFADVSPSYIHNWNLFDEIDDIDDMTEKTSRIGSIYDEFMTLSESNPISRQARDDYLELYHSTLDTLSITHVMYTKDDINDILSNMRVHDSLSTIITSRMDESMTNYNSDSISIGDIIRIVTASCIVISIGVCTYVYFRHKQKCN